MPPKRKTGSTKRGASKRFRSRNTSEGTPGTTMCSSSSQTDPLPSAPGPVHQLGADPKAVGTDSAGTLTRSQSTSMSGMHTQPISDVITVSAADFIQDLTPLEILVQGRTAQEAYQRASQAGTRPMYRTRLMLVGQERVGKTSLLNVLTGQRYNEEEDITDGVDTTKYATISRKNPQDPWQLECKDKSDRTGHITKQYQAAVISDMAKSLKSDTNTASSSTETPSVDDSVSASRSTATPILDPTMVTKLKLSKSLPDQIKEKLVERMSGNVTDDDDIHVQFWDFAGQDLYYNTHQVFFNSRAIFVLLFDMSKPLHEAVEVQDFSLDKESSGSRFHEFTPLKFLTFWLESVFMYATSATTQLSSIPIIIVGTHRAEQRSQVEQKQSMTESEIGDCILSAIKGKPYEHLVKPTIFFVENDSNLRSHNDEEAIQSLRKYIEEIARNEPYMGKEVPIKWLQFESVLVEMAASNKPYIALKEAKNQASKLGIVDDTELFTVLQFYHDIGTIMYYGTKDKSREKLLQDVVILDPQWLIDVFKRIITVLPMDIEDSKLRPMWQKLQTKGILTEELIDHVWNDISHLKPFLIELMQVFDLLCEIKPDEPNTHAIYLVPSCILPNKQKETTHETSERLHGVAFYFNCYGFLPDDFVNKLVLRVSKWSHDESGKAPKLRHRGGEFYLGDQTSLQIKVTVSPYEVTHFVKVSVEKTTEGYVTLPNAEVSPEEVSHVKSFLIRTVEDLGTKWKQKIKYDVAVSCSACEKSSSDIHMILLKECYQMTVRCKRTGQDIQTRKYLDMLGEGFASKLTKSIDHNGGILNLPHQGFSLKIPVGALDKNENITISVASSEHGHPHLDNGCIIAPIVRLEPDNLQLLKPATLTVVHSGVDLRLDNLQVWTKSNGDCEEWRVEFDRGVTSGHLVVRLENDNIKLRLTHFSPWCVIGRCRCKWEILPYIESDLLQSETILMSVFAVRKHAAKNFKNLMKKDNNFTACWLHEPLPNVYKVQPTKDLQLHLKIVKDRRNNDVWICSEKSKVIPHEDLQELNGNSCCNFEFTKARTRQRIDSIFGNIDVKQENDGPVKVTFKYSMATRESQSEFMGSSIAGPSSLLDANVTNTSPMITTQQITDVVRMLTRDQCQELYTELKLTPQEIDRAECSTASYDPVVKARAVLIYWLQENGISASASAMIAAMERCKFRQAIESLNWN